MSVFSTRVKNSTFQGQPQASRDRLHALLCAAGYNIRWLLRQIAKKCVAFLHQVYLRLCQIVGLSPTWSLALRKRQDLALIRSASHLGLA
ncbi:MAG TPA: hypothetical protein PKZ19_11305 [Zoogloea sp.]|nr:hypothetical protein [Zoogloea sp.]